MLGLPSDATRIYFKDIHYFSTAAIHFKDKILLEKQKKINFLKLFQQNKQLTKEELLEIFPAEIK